MTNDARPIGSDRRYTVWIGATLGLFLLAVGIGFIWLPSAQRDAGSPNLWDAICRAIGLPKLDAPIETSVGGKPASTVAWTPATRELLARGNAGRGAALAGRCNDCHGEKGVSADEAIPNLAGQSASAIYKQLQDFRSGKRNPTLMGDFVAPLSQQDMADLAAYFAARPDPFAHASATGGNDGRAKELVELGIPMRAIAACAACHGPPGLLPGAPALQGQQRAYLEEQLQSFKAGRRGNDAGGSMRSIARQLSQAEIEQLAAYYASFPAGTQR